MLPSTSAHYQAPIFIIISTLNTICKNYEGDFDLFNMNLPTLIKILTDPFWNSLKLENEIHVLIISIFTFHRNY